MWRLAAVVLLAEAVAGAPPCADPGVCLDSTRWNTATCRCENPDCVAAPAGDEPCMPQQCKQHQCPFHYWAGLDAPPGWESGGYLSPLGSCFKDEGQQDFPGQHLWIKCDPGRCKATTAVQDADADSDADEDAVELNDFDTEGDNYSPEGKYGAADTYGNAIADEDAAEAQAILADQDGTDPFFSDQDGQEDGWESST